MRTFSAYLFIILVAVLRAGAPAYAGTVGPDGWTVFTASADTRKVYVSSSGGNDNNDGLSVNTPKQTLAAAYTLIRDGYPDWLLLKRGDSWDEAMPFWNKEGRNANEVMLVGSYGNGNRPLLRTGINNGFQCIAQNGAHSGPRAHMAITDLHLWANQNNGQDGVGTGLQIANGWSDVSVENCFIEQYSVNVALWGSELWVADVRLRRCVIYHSLYGSGSHRSTGILVGQTTGLLLEECIFDHNGWSETIPGAYPIDQSHNVYINPDNTSNVTTRANIVARGSASGLRSSGGLCEDNLVLQNPIGIVVGPDTHTVRNNVILDSRDIAGDPRGLGMDGTIGANVEIAGNIVAHQVSGTGNTKAMNFGGSYDGLSVHDNIVYHWTQAANTAAMALNLGGSAANSVRVFNNQFQQPGGALIYGDGNTVLSTAPYVFSGNKYFSENSVIYQPFAANLSQGTIDYQHWLQQVNDTGSTYGAVSYLDPERSIATYMSSLGQPASLPAFMTETRNQDRGNWRTAYTSYTVNAYIRAGFQTGTTVNHPPVITAGPFASPNPATTGQTVSFSVTASDPDSDPLTFNWNFGDGSTGTGAAPTHAYAAANIYSVSVTVSDGRGGSVNGGPLQVQVNAPANHPPVILSGPTASPNLAQTGQTVTFTVSASDADNDPLTYTWNFGDGSTGSGATSTHIYAAANTYSVTVTVNDGHGGSVAGGPIQVLITTVPPPDFNITIDYVSTDRAYTVGTATVKARCYTDTSRVFTSVGANLSNQPSIRTANADRAVTAAQYLQFSINAPATVYICFDGRYTNLPAWVAKQGWTLTTETVKDNTSSKARKVYAKSFPAGQVMLSGGYRGSGTKPGTNYYVIVKP